MGCRNTVFSAKAQSGAPYLSSFMTAGLRHYRIELVDEQAQYVAPLLNHYHDLLKLCAKAIAAASLIDGVAAVATNTNNNGKGDVNKRGEINKRDHKKDDTSRRGDTNSRGVTADIDAQVDVLWSFLEQLPNGHGVPQGESHIHSKHVLHTSLPSNILLIDQRLMIIFSRLLAYFQAWRWVHWSLRKRRNGPR